jgi:cobalamin biosynthesis protein CobT
MEKTVHYRSPDPIQNLRIKVVLTRLSGPRRTQAKIETKDTEGTKDRKSAKKDKKKEKEKKKHGKGDSDDDDDDDASEKSNSDSEEETPEKNKGNRRDRRKEKDTRADKKDTDKKTQPEDTPDALKLEDEQVTTREFSWQHKVRELKDGCSVYTASTTLVLSIFFKLNHVACSKNYRCPSEHSKSRGSEITDAFGIPFHTDINENTL